MSKRVFRVLDLKRAPRLRTAQKIQRIEMDVVENMQKIRIGADAYFFCAPLEESTGTRISLIKIIILWDKAYKNGAMMIAASVMNIT